MDIQTLEKFDKLQEKIDKLEKDISDLTEEYYRNNYSTYQLFTKFSNFSTGLKIPNKDRLPAKSENGELIECKGALYIGYNNSWQMVGTQS